jgi:protein involved in polysaccharide export with SLBB domain
VSLLKYKLFVDRICKNKTLLIMVLSVLLPVGLAGCGDNVHLPSSKELAEFENAGPVPPSIDTNRLVQARIGGGPYHVVPGDAIELTMPAVVRFISVKEFGSNNTVSPYITRVNEDGNITLPIVGDIKASGRTLSQIESDIIDAYFPKHVVTRPSVFARVLDYRTSRVSITGAVRTPGIYSLRSDQMSLVALLMAAGGIIDEGAALIKIIHSDQAMSSNENAEIKTTAQSFGAPVDQSETLPAESSIEQIVDDEKEIPSFFRQAYSSSAIGALAIGKGDKRRPDGQLNTANDSPKPLLVDRLVWEKPQASTTLSEGERFLSTEPVKDDNLKSDIRNTNSDGKTIPNTESLMHQLQLGAKEDVLLGQNVARTSTSNNVMRVQKVSESGSSRKSDTIVLPIKGYNIPFADVALEGGDSVIVDRLQAPLFTVMGLVNSPGNFTYPPDIKFTLMQAIGFGGGLNLIADPRYVTIYRLKRNGTCIHATFPIKGNAKLANASNTLIKPGDIIAVEHTPRTRTAIFLDRIFRISIGTYWSFDNNGTLN